jgi:uncharacterized membrane protein (UPF0127 family)
MAPFSAVGRLVVIGAVLSVTGCTSPVENAEAPVLTQASVQEGPRSTLPRGDVRGFPVTDVVWIRGSESEVLPVFLAATSGRRSRGLMGVGSLGEVAGMVFEWPETSVGSFWMKDTLISLEVAFIDTEGVVFAIFEMEPCAAEPCPTYKPETPYHLAFEWPAGALEVEVGDVIRLEDRSR